MRSVKQKKGRTQLCGPACDSYGRFCEVPNVDTPIARPRRSRFIYFWHFLPNGFSPKTIRKQKRRGQEFLPSDGRCTGTQKLLRRGHSRTIREKAERMQARGSPTSYSAFRRLNFIFCKRVGGRCATGTAPPLRAPHSPVLTLSSRCVGLRVCACR